MKNLICTLSVILSLSSLASAQVYDRNERSDEIKMEISASNPFSVESLSCDDDVIYNYRNDDSNSETTIESSSFRIKQLVTAPHGESKEIVMTLVFAGISHKDDCNLVLKDLTYKVGLSSLMSWEQPPLTMIIEATPATYFNNRNDNLEFVVHKAYIQ